jgi:hypothetical protein
MYAMQPGTDVSGFRIYVFCGQRKLQFGHGTLEKSLALALALNAETPDFA